ncbi:complex I subunit 4 family protein [Thiofilum flexile]|uniref:complex I subunit 4 family protein n=1 Tax=Thiofilum flexile TaxID=125627 RepID=UPI000378AA91|nr:NADH-quinone oxidoreductase subunit M [Thiofilum flexile]
MLSWLVWLPIIAGAGLLILNNRPWLHWAALGIAAVTFVLSLFLLLFFDGSSASLQWVERVNWIDIAGIKIDYYLGVDGIALPLVLLNTFITLFAIGSGWENKRQPAQFFAAFVIMEGVVNGVFLAQDAMLFYIFFEAMLIPLFIIIGVWGGPKRVYATIKFFLYTFFGSVFFFISLIYLYQHANGSFALQDLYRHPVGQDAQALIFFALLLAFGVKIPMWPVHTWLPDAHVEAPTAGSVILAAITLKVGGYAIIRFVLPLLSDAVSMYYWVPMVLSLIAIVYIGFVALVQTDMKKLIAYSSIAHMGFVTLGFFMVHWLVGSGGDADIPIVALQGAMVQMVSHGFISAAMFLCIGVLYDRMHTREIKAYGGVVNRMPWLATFFVFFAMANAALPGTSGFVGEFLVITASVAWTTSILVALTASLTLVIGAAYNLWLVKRVIWGEVTHAEVDKLDDLSRREMLMLGGLAVAVLVLGLWPAPLMDIMNASLDHLIQHIRAAVELKGQGVQ